MLICLRCGRDETKGNDMDQNENLDEDSSENEEGLGLSEASVECFCIAGHYWKKVMTFKLCSMLYRPIKTLIKLYTSCFNVLEYLLDLISRSIKRKVIITNRNLIFIFQFLKGGS